MPTTRFYLAHLLLGSALALLALSATCHAGVIAPAAPPAPISLTASDGTGLELVSLTADAVVEDPLAFTELHLVFQNPEHRVREGRFRITLPPGATISRFAMRIGDRWQEGEVVEQQAARVAYEDFLHRRQDPALLEAEAGNEFSARVFPIPAGGDQGADRLVLAGADPRRASPTGCRCAGCPGWARCRSGRWSSKTGGDRRRLEHGRRARPARGRRGRERRTSRPDRDFEVPLGRAAARPAPRQPGGRAHRPAWRTTDRRDPVTSLSCWSTPAPRARSASREQIASVEALLAELRQGRRSDGDGGGVRPGRGARLHGQGAAASATACASGCRRGGRWAPPISSARWAGWRRAARSVHARVLLVTDGVATAGARAATSCAPQVKALARGGRRAARRAGAWAASATTSCWRAW